MTTHSLTYADLDAKKTDLIAHLAVADPGRRALLGTQIAFLEYLMTELTPPRPKQREYLVLYRVTWQPETEDEDPPMDSMHGMHLIDERCVTYSMVGIGTQDNVEDALREEIERDPLYYGPEGA